MVTSVIFDIIKNKKSILLISGFASVLGCVVFMSFLISDYTYIGHQYRIQSSVIKENKEESIILIPIYSEDLTDYLCETE